MLRTPEAFEQFQVQAPTKLHAAGAGKPLKQRTVDSLTTILDAGPVPGHVGARRQDKVK